MDVPVPDDDDHAVDALSQFRHPGYEQRRRGVDDDELDLGGQLVEQGGQAHEAADRVPAQAAPPGMTAREPSTRAPRRRAREPTRGLHLVGMRAVPSVRLDPPQHGADVGGAGEQLVDPGRGRGCP